MKFSLLFILILGSCTTASPWKFESILTGEQVFDSARLIYSSENDSPLRFEIVRLETEVEAFLNLKKYKFTTLDDVKLELYIDDEKSEESVPFLEGKMRLRFPKATTEKIIKALQEGREVAIVVDGFEQHLSAESFTKQYEKMISGNKAIFRNPFKGLFNP